VKSVHDPWPQIRKHKLTQIQAHFVDNETALLRKYAGQALLSLLAHWPETMRFSFESVGDHSLLAFLKYVAAEYLTGATPSDSTQLGLSQGATILAGASSSSSSPLLLYTFNL
jgi:hypothetical protein